MSLRRKSRILALAALAASCSTPAPSRTIEPKAEDDQFTISRAPSGAQVNVAAYPIHLAEKWYPFRATFLSITPEAAINRDGTLSDVSAPAQFWDEQTAVEAVSIWSALCNECHGGRRKLKDATSMPKPVPGWGKGSGLFFGKRRPYAEIFGTISGGGPERNGKQSEMPSWRQKLSREQIWSVIYFLEFQSGGIEGTFPPSLYPRGAQETD